MDGKERRLVQVSANPRFHRFQHPLADRSRHCRPRCRGRHPPALEGAFYRVQPDPQFPPLLGDDIAFNGDGMITMFHFKNGKVNFRQRWAHTDKWKLEHEAGRGPVRRLPQSADRRSLGEGRIRGTANTNAFVHGGKLYALKEDSPALVMDPVTLETEGYSDFGGNDRPDLHRPSQDRSRDRRHDRLRLCLRRACCTKDMIYYEVTPGRGR